MGFDRGYWIGKCLAKCLSLVYWMDVPGSACVLIDSCL